MVKIKLTKDQIMGKAGDVVDATKERVNYLIRVGSAIEYKEPAKPKTKPKTVKKPAKKKNAKG